MNITDDDIQLGALEIAREYVSRGAEIPDEILDILVVSDEPEFYDEVDN